MTMIYPLQIFLRMRLTGHLQELLFHLIHVFTQQVILIKCSTVTDLRSYECICYICLHITVINQNVVSRNVKNKLTVSQVFIRWHKLINDIMTHGSEREQLREQNTLLIKQVHQHMKAECAERTEHKRQEEQKQMCTCNNNTTLITILISNYLTYL